MHIENTHLLLGKGVVAGGAPRAAALVAAAGTAAAFFLVSTVPSALVRAVPFRRLAGLRRPLLGRGAAGRGVNGGVVCCCIFAGAAGRGGNGLAAARAAAAAAGSTPLDQEAALLYRQWRG